MIPLWWRLAEGLYRERVYVCIIEKDANSGHLKTVEMEIEVLGGTS